MVAQLTELNGRLTDLVTEIEEQKGTIAKQKQENKKLAAEMSEVEQRTQGFEK
jgi:peptidoglycan hydrolase CwlO-like protein